jgi:glycosyltransferase involved in cell wall biosynthesis
MDQSWMKTNPLVTIAIPTYNRANAYLRQALESARAQTYTNLDIFVSDNCSTDWTSQLVAECNDPRIRYFRHPTNVGPHKNINFCIAQARGEFLLVLHDDDTVDPDFVETCLSAIVDDSADFGLIRTGMRIIDASGNVVKEAANRARGQSLADFFLMWLSGETPFYMCCTLFSTEKLQSLGGLHSAHNLYNDIMAALKLAAKFGRVDIPEIKASFRVHSAEYGFGARIADWCDDSRQLLDLMCELAPEKEVIIRKEGLRILSRRNYSRAGMVKPPVKRALAYFTVFRMSGYSHPPSLTRILNDSPSYQRIRQVEILRKLKRGFAAHLLRFRG